MISPRGHASRRKVKFVESEPQKVELSEGALAVKVQTPPCIFCGKTSIVMLSREEFKAVAEGELPIQEALPKRDAGFRDLVAQGTHPACWDKATGDTESEGETDEGTT